MNADLPPVSILIPTYHSDQTLDAALSGALRQQYRPLEIVVSDDGTPGFDAEKVRAFAASVAPSVPCTVLAHETNQGTVRNLNAALNAAKGKWIFFLAGDDVLMTEDAVAQMMETAAREASRWVVPRILENGRLIPDDELCALIREKNARELYWRLSCDCVLPFGGGLLERRLLEAASAFDASYRLVEDWPLMLKLVRAGCLPAVSDCVILSHGTDGISGKRAGRNLAYQADLIQVMEREILPNLPTGDPARQKKLTRRIRDKQDIYQFRSVCRTPVRKLCWLFLHFGVIIRKIMEKMGKNQ